MFSFLFFAVLCTSCLAAPLMNYSYSPSVGGGSGTSFATTGEGRITGIRVYERSSAYICGIQLRYGDIWDELVGGGNEHLQELELFDGETIVQVSGKYQNSYIYQIRFVTSRGRSLVAGQPTYNSFNFYANHPDAELKLLSGRFNSAGITSLGAHWGTITHQSHDTYV